MSTTTKNCEECAHHRAVLGNELACALDHKPRWYSPKGTLDQNYGWKRKCDDFRPTGWADFDYGERYDEQEY